MRSWILRNFYGFAVWLGAACVYWALLWGAGFDLGWWALLLWVGLGFVWGGLTGEISEIVKRRDGRK